MPDRGAIVSKRTSRAECEEDIAHFLDTGTPEDGYDIRLRRDYLAALHILETIVTDATISVSSRRVSYKIDKATIARAAAFIAATEEVTHDADAT